MAVEPPIAALRDERAELAKPLIAIFAQSLDRSGYARGTLSPQPGMQAEVPRLDPRPLLTMMDMGMGHNMAGMDTSGMKDMDHGSMEGMGHGRDNTKAVSPIVDDSTSTMRHACERVTPMARRIPISLNR